MVDHIDQNIIDIREKIRSAAKRSGRDPSEIKLMGVTKTHPVEYILSAAPKLDIIGENRVQEASEKRSKMPFGNQYALAPYRTPPEE